MEIFDYGVANICLSDIPKESIKVASNGKKYVRVCVKALKDTEIDDNGDVVNTHCLYMAQSREEKDAKTPKHYVGRFKQYPQYNQESTQGSSVSRLSDADFSNMPSLSDDDDLPF